MARRGGSVTVGGETLRVVGTYAAASGRTCRRLADARGVVLPRVSCRQANGDWTLGRSLGGQGPDGVAPPRGTSRSSPLVSEPVTGAAKPALVVTPLDREPEAVVEALHRDETLWAFAARVTGDPLNWTRIARFNGIEEVTAVESGRTLRVPSALALSVR